MIDSTLTAKARSGPAFQNKETAIAYAKSLKGSVIIRHQQWYLVHGLDDHSLSDFDRDNIKQMTGSKHVWTNITKEGSEVPGVVAFVTEDGWPIEAKLGNNRDTKTNRYHQRTATVPGQMGLLKFIERPDKLPADVLEPYRQGGLDNKSSDEQYLRGFHNAMRDLALDTLGKSEAEVRAQRPRFAGQSVPDRAVMNEVARLLAQKDTQLKDAQQDAKKAPAGRKAAAEETLKQRKLERQIILDRAPVLAMVDPARFAGMAAPQQAAFLHGQMGDILANIETTRENILNGKLTLWDLAPIVQATMSGLRLNPKGSQAQLVEQKAATEKRNELIVNIAVAVFQLGLAIGAAVASGGLSLALGGAALAVGAGDATYQTQRYMARSSASLTAIDPERSIINPKELGMEGFWVVVAWVGVGIDAAAAVKAVKALKSGKAVSEVLQESGKNGVTREMLESAQKELNIAQDVGHGTAEGVGAGTRKAGSKGQDAATVGNKVVGAADGVSPDGILDAVSNRLRQQAGIDASTVEKWVSKHGAAKAAEMMGDTLLDAAGLKLDDALRLMKQNPQKFYQDYGALLAGAVLRRGANARAASKAATDIAGALPEAQLVQFADEVGFSVMTHFTPDGRSAKILSSGELLPGSNSGGLIWGTTRYTQDPASLAQSLSFADYARKARSPIPLALPKDLLIPPSGALETKALPKFLNEKAYAVKGLLQSTLGKAAKAPPVAMHGPIHLLPQGVAMTADEVLAFQGRIAGAINTKAGEAGKTAVLIGLGTGNGVLWYYFLADRTDK